MAGDAEHETPPRRRPSTDGIVAGRAAPRRQRRPPRRAVDDPGDRLPASTTAAPTTRPTGCSPRCSTPTRRRPPSWPSAYAQRWEIEAVFDELKTHQRGARTVLRSKSPDLVLQEIWGHLCCHYAIRTLMLEAADRADVDPDRVSFVAALRIVRRSIAAARDFPPSAPLTTAGATPSRLLCRRLNPARRRRANPAPDQTQVRQMARQTSPTPPLAATHRTTHRHHPLTLTERYWD